MVLEERKMIERKKNSGFSIIEVLTAVAVLMIGLTAIISLQVSGIHWLAAAKHKTVAVHVGEQMLELLKTAPVNRDNPSDILPVNMAFGSTVIYNIQVRDNPVDLKALLWDSAVADGYNTWHRLSPVTAEGTICTCTPPTCDNWRPYCFYLVAYGVEWGGVTGSHFIQATGGSPYASAWYPEIIPGAFEMYIELWVGWVEPGDHQVLGSVQNPTVKDYFVNMNSTFPNYPAVFPKHRVVLKTIRRLPAH
jgi:Tfp pilus assembly protein PilV